MRSILEAPAPIERAATQTAPGRAPLLGFVADGETERNLHECLDDLGLADTPIARGGIAKAIEVLGAQRSPEILIVDVSGVSMPVLEIHNLADVCEPGVTVIAIGDCNEVGLYRDLLHSGVTDYIFKPLTTPLLARALNSRTNAAEPGGIQRKLGTTVAFVGTRGGVGTTTLAVNLAWYLAERQSRRVAVVDLDLYNGDCAMGLNVKATPGLREALVNPGRIDSVLLERVMAPVGERLFIMSAEEPLRDTIEFTADALDTLVTALRHQFHYVVLDVPRNSAAPFMKALDMADFRVVVADQTLRSARDAVRLREALATGTGSYRNILVINRQGEGGRRAITLEEMENILKLRPKAVIPFHPAWFAPTADHSATVAAAGRGRFGDAVAALALELSGRPPQRRRRWWASGR